MTDLEIIKTTIENSLQIIGKKMGKSDLLINRANLDSRYIISIKKIENYHLDSSKMEELENYRKALTFKTIKVLKISDLISKDIKTLSNTLTSNKNTSFFSNLFNEMVEIKRKLNDQIFDAKNLLEKFGNSSIDFNSVNLEKDEYEIQDFDLIYMGVKNNDFNFAYYDNMVNKYGKTDKSNIDVIHNGYTQRSFSFVLNKKLRKGESLDKNEEKIYFALINACNDNKLENNIYLFRYVSQEFINKYNIEFNRLNQSSIANAVFKFKKNLIDKNIKEKEKGFISSSCNLENNVFKSRDVLSFICNK